MMLIYIEYSFKMDCHVYHIMSYKINCKVSVKSPLYCYKTDGSNLATVDQLFRVRVKILVYTELRFPYHKIKMDCSVLHS